MRTISIVGISSNAFIRSGLQPIVSKASLPNEVIGTFSDFASAEEFLRTNHCDVLVMDDSLPRTISLIKHIKAMHDKCPGVAILLVLQNPIVSLFQAFLSHGVRGVLHRNDRLEYELPHAIISVREGGTYLSPGISRLKDTHNDKSFEITPRAFDILRLTAKGYNAKEISVQIELCNKSVYRVLRTLRENHGVQSNFQLFLIAQQLGLLSSDDLE
jgi:DNA-binding NarL/FixJ family response regulator